MTQPQDAQQTLDLRTTKCPLNFVKTRLALEKMAVGEVLEIWILADSQSSMNIPQSIAQEGHKVLQTLEDADGLQRIFILKQH